MRNNKHYPLRAETYRQLPAFPENTHNKQYIDLDMEILATCVTIRSAESFMPVVGEHETGGDTFLNRQREKLRGLLARLVVTA